MNHFLISTAGLLAALLMTGCSSSSFTPAAMQNGALVRQDAALPVYLSPPQIEYRVIGIINVSVRAHGNPDAKAVEQARKQGANALILMKEGTVQTGSYETSSGGATHFANGTTVYSGGSDSTAIMRKQAQYMAIHISEPASTAPQANAKPSTPIKQE